MLRACCRGPLPRSFSSVDLLMDVWEIWIYARCESMVRITEKCANCESCDQTRVTKTIEISQIDSIAMYKLPYIYIYMEDLRMNNRNICHCRRDWTRCSKSVKYCKFNSQHGWGRTYMIIYEELSSLSILYTIFV